MDAVANFLVELFFVMVIAGAFVPFLAEVFVEIVAAVVAALAGAVAIVAEWRARGRRRRP